MDELIIVKDGVALLDADASQKIADLEKALKYIKESEDAMKQSILAEMEAKGIIKVETEELTINYIASTDRETFDSKAFKADHADLFDEYVKMSPVKSSVRIKLK